MNVCTTVLTGVPKKILCTFETFSNIFFSKKSSLILLVFISKKMFNFAFRVSEVFDECLVSNSC